jgi:CcmD family protein
VRIIRRLVCVWSVVLGLILCASPLLSAQQGGQEGFVPVSPGDLQQERLPATPLVFAAYAFVWVALVAYIFMLWRRLGRVERELAEVNARLNTGKRS